jgi:basic membrane lipoprotein Med (substrate-binding protein (PBP1-ABC) superfamily)
MESTTIMLVYNIKRYKHTHGTGFKLKSRIKEVTYKSKTYFAIITTYFSLSRENNKTGLQFAAYKTACLTVKNKFRRIF